MAPAAKVSQLIGIFPYILGQSGQAKLQTGLSASWVRLWCQVVLRKLFLDTGASLCCVAGQASRVREVTLLPMLSGIRAHLMRVSKLRGVLTASIPLETSGPIQG